MAKGKTLKSFRPFKAGSQDVLSHFGARSPERGGQAVPKTVTASARLLGGDGAVTGPGSESGDVFGAGNGERTSGAEFGKEDIGGKLLLRGKGGVKAAGDGLFNFGPGEAVAGSGEFVEIKGTGIAAAALQMDAEQLGARGGVG